MNCVLGILGDWTTHVENGWDLVGLVALIAAVLAFVFYGVRLSVTDVRLHLLPNKLLFPWMRWALLLLVIAGLTHGDPQRALRTVAGGVVLFIGYLLLHLLSRSGMGMGDVKLAFVLGLYLGFASWWHVLWGTMFAFLLGALVALVGIVAGRMGHKTAIPFGPFMIVGALLALAIGS